MAVKGQIVTGTFAPKDLDVITEKAKEKIGATCKWTYVWRIKGMGEDLEGMWALAPNDVGAFPFRWAPEEDVEIQEDA